jgi:nanoRNase/pAp phosphatase (c-di-AMP/oligoRNAs hydrolase)
LRGATDSSCMIERLILGSGSLISTVARDSNRSVRVGTPDDQLASTLQETGIETELLDPTDAGTLSGLDAELVFVLEDTEDAALAAARTVSRALPDAYLVAYAGRDGAQDSPLSSVADRLLDPGRVVASRVLESVSEPQLSGLWHVLRDIDRLAVVAHDNPDPDAIASGVALAELAREAGCETQVCYYGSISHQENRAFVNVLDLDLQNLDPGAELAAFDGIALVDHARPGINDQLPSSTAVDIVIDHHPPRGPVDARFVDLRSGVGATCTLLVEYLTRAGCEMQADVATALLFGIHVDTDEFNRGVSTQDFEAAATLVETAELETIARIESPSIDWGTFDVLARAISDRRVEDGVVLSFVGNIGSRDALPQAADRLLNVDKIETTVVYGIIDGTVYVSARSRADGLDLGETVREAFGPVGAAGGHVDMAGAQIDLGLLGELEDDESVAPLVRSVVADRFLDVLAEGSPSGQLLSTLDGTDWPGSADESGDAAADGDEKPES